MLEAISGFTKPFRFHIARETPFSRILGNANLGLSPALRSPPRVFCVTGAYLLLKCLNESKFSHSPSSRIGQACAKTPASFEHVKAVLLTRVEGSDFRVFSPDFRASVSAHHRSMWAPHWPLRPGIVAFGTP